MSVPGQSATQLLNDWRSGDESAADRLLPLVYKELRAMAQQMLAAERRSHTLQATALVHEAYLRLFDQTRVDWEDRLHFFAVAARTLRRVLVDHARARLAEKRGGAAGRLTLTESLAVATRPGGGLDLLELEEALSALEACDERQARVVELRFFAGLDVEQTSQLLGVSARTVKEDWRFAKAWLRVRLSEAESS